MAKILDQHQYLQHNLLIVRDCKDMLGHGDCCATTTHEGMRQRMHVMSCHKKKQETEEESALSDATQVQKSQRNRQARRCLLGEAAVLSAHASTAVS